MRLLFLSPQLPWPPVSGARLRVYHLLRAAASAHDVDLLAFSDPEPPAEALVRLDALCADVALVPAPPPRPPLRRLVATVASPLPDLAERLWSTAMRWRLAARLAERPYAAVQASGLEMGRYLLDVRGPRRILDEFNVEYRLQQSVARADWRTPASWPGAAYSTVQTAKLKAFEALLCRRADLVLSVSEPDARDLRRLAPGTPVHVVPNGVDTAALPYHDPAPDPPPNLLFTGSLDYRPNVDAALWFIHAVLPALKATVPNVRFFIVGHRPPPPLVEAGKHDTAIAVTGSVPDLQPYWDQAAVYVLPMRMGGGVRFKALEALALGLPLVSTGFGMQGVQAQDGTHYLQADSPRDFATAVVRLLANHDLRVRLARAGRALAEQRLDWRHVEPRLLAAYQALPGLPLPAEARR